MSDTKWDDKKDDADNALTLFGRSMIEGFISGSKKKPKREIVKPPSQPPQQQQPTIQKNITIDNRQVKVINIHGGTNNVMMDQTNTQNNNYSRKKRKRR